MGAVQFRTSLTLILLASLRWTASRVLHALTRCLLHSTFAAQLLGDSLKSVASHITVFKIIDFQPYYKYFVFIVIYAF